MNPFNPLFSVIVFSIAFSTGYIIKLYSKTNLIKGRYECIDGMRGFLALAVFIHHSTAWYQSFQLGDWEPSKSNLYEQLGKVSVSLFFMITSFLFISKLLNAKEKGFNWRSFFISRFFRLVPMYYFSIWLVIVILLLIGQWPGKVGSSEFLISIINWFFFRIHLIHTTTATELSCFFINLGVDWSLAYEWLFYFSLPLISLFILKIKPKIGYIIFSVFFIILFYKIHGIVEYHIYSFTGGAIAAILLKFTALKDKIKDIYSSIIIFICLFLLGQFNNSENIYCILLITIIFTLIALGASIFGLLRNSVLKFLGEISYSTYLLHPILLFSVFRFGYSFDGMYLLSPLEYCLVTFAMTPILVFISFLGFRYIEKINIDRAKKIIQNLENKEISQMKAKAEGANK